MQLIGLGALFLSIVWMLRDDKDKTRPILVLALVFNLFYFTLAGVVLRREGTLLYWKFDNILFNLDKSLGISSGPLVVQLQGVSAYPLGSDLSADGPDDDLSWFLVTKGQSRRKALILAYVTELICGPILYSVLPACGPVYAFGSKWLRPDKCSTEFDPLEWNAKRIPLVAHCDSDRACFVCPEHSVADCLGGVSHGHDAGHYINGGTLSD